MRLFASLIVTLSLLSTGFAQAHEFWIEAHAFEIESGENVVADIRIGQGFGGSPFAFIPPNFVRFDMVQGDQVVVVDSRVGDRPALNMAMPDGLWIAVHETTDSNLTYSEWEKFAGFVEHKAFDNVLETHMELGLPEVGFLETYRRFAKSLIAVGDGAGADRALGLRTEIIALANPYVDDVTGGVPVLVQFENAPRVGVQVEVFEKDSAGEVIVFTTQTDAKGVAMIPVKAGHSYMLDAVVMLAEEYDDPVKDAVWRSLWANLTFAVPE